jgi:serine/threonine-protein phosphatase 5
LLSIFTSTTFLLTWSRIDPKYIKAYYRRGSANYALGKLKLALKDFKAVVTIVPKDPDALKKYKQCEKDIREEAFLKAIETEDQSEPPIDPETILVEETYSGPRLETDPSTKQPLVTTEFVLATMQYMKQQKFIHRRYVIHILQAALKHLSSLTSLMSLYLPTVTDADGEVSHGAFTVCGDTHGQYYDLLNIFELAGLPSERNYFLFNGDFVDRGSFSFETVFLLLCWKLALPQALHMSRGNHETK